MVTLMTYASSKVLEVGMSQTTWAEVAVTLAAVRLAGGRGPDRHGAGKGGERGHHQV